MALCSYSYSEEPNQTTQNLLSPIDDWSLEVNISNSQCSYSGALEVGELCTGGAIEGGSIIGGGYADSNAISLITDGGLTQDQINSGVVFTYGVDVQSHSSNLSVPSCDQTNNDCIDQFTIGITLTEPNGNLIEKYSHNVEMNYEGLQSYSYQQSIEANNYTDIYSTMNLWGVDAGYTSGYYGAIFSNPYLTVQYSTVDLITDLVIGLVDDIIQDDFINYQDDFIDINIDFGDMNFEPIQFEYELIPASMPMEIETIQDIEIINSIESFDTDMTESFELELVETTEMEIQQSFQEVDIESFEDLPIIEEVLVEEIPEEIIVEENSDNPEPEIEEEVIEEETIEEEVIEEEVIEEEIEEQETLTVEEKKQELKLKIAKKIIAKNEDRYSPESQAVQVAVMVALSNIKDFQEYQNLEITESLTWYQTQNIYQDQEMIFDTNAYYLHHIEDKMFNDFENLQWQLQ